MGRWMVLWVVLWAGCTVPSDAGTEGTSSATVADAARREPVRRPDRGAGVTTPWTSSDLADLLGARHVEDLPSNAVLARRAGASEALATLAGSPDVSPAVSARALRVWVAYDAASALPVAARVARDAARPDFERAAAIGALVAGYAADPTAVTSALIDVLRGGDSRSLDEVRVAIEGAVWRGTFVDAALHTDGVPVAARSALSAR